MSADGVGAPIRILTFSTLYPNSSYQNHGVFVENRLRHLVEGNCVESTVIAPVPWFPFKSRLFGSWARLNDIPSEEARHGLRVLHPRYLTLPWIGMSVAPHLLYRFMVPFIQQLLGQVGKFDLIDAHYLYPDGVAAVWLGRRFGLPVVVTARGSDVTLIPKYHFPRLLITRALSKAAAIIAVSSALKQELVRLGVPSSRVTVLRNGVDTELFKPPRDRNVARARVGFLRPTLLSVGLLIERKGHERTIRALAYLPEFELVIVGDGPDRKRLERVAQTIGVSERVRMIGSRPHYELSEMYGAADMLVLSSTREGWANVLLESMACGTPVIVSNIPGSCEIVQRPEAGLIVEENTPEAIARAIRRLWTCRPARGSTRAYAENFSWEEVSVGQQRLFARVIGKCSSVALRSEFHSP